MKTTPQKEKPTGGSNPTAGYTKQDSLIFTEPGQLVQPQTNYPLETPSDKQAALLTIFRTIPGRTAAVQRQRIRAGLAKFGLNTDEIRRYLDCYDARKRVSELRKAGEPIVTHWQRILTEAGEPHRVGLYILVLEPAQ